MNVRLDEDIDTSYSVQLNLLILVESPVAHGRHVLATGLVLLITYTKIRHIPSWEVTGLCYLLQELCLSIM